ncbi:hypothetical protein EMIT0162MI3_30052 [Pseudomonas chlororaphis]
MRLNELKPLCGKGWLGHASAGCLASCSVSC